MPQASPRPAERNWRSNITGILIAVAITFSLTALLHWRVDAAAPKQRMEPMPVATTTYRLQPGFERQRQFLGLVEAGKRADLGFESAGLIEDIEVREGSVVAAGDLLATLDKRRLQAQRAAAAAELDTLQADLELARLRAERQKNLQATGAGSKEAYDETRLGAEALSAQRKAVAARLQQIDIELEKHSLRAPYDGIVAAVYQDAGAVTSAGLPVLRLIQSGAREAHVGVAPELAGTLQPGQDYALAWRDKHITAQLRGVRPDVDPATRAAIAVFNLPKSAPALDGEPVSLGLPSYIDEPGGWLPLSALLEGQRGIWNVLAIQPGAEGGYITTREIVEVLELRDNLAYVRGTLQDGQTVVADGVHRIAPGSAVTPLAE